MLSGTRKLTFSAMVTYAPGAILRDQPALAGSRIKRLAEGALYPVLGRTSDAAWLLLQVESQPGWVWSYHLRLTSQPDTLPIVKVK